MEAVEVNGYTIEPGANLTGADLSGANFIGVDPEGDLVSANLVGVKANEETIWPEGFDPVDAGVIFA